MIKDFWIRLSLYFAIVLIVVSCKSDTPKAEYYQVRGETMGTYYAIKYQDARARNLQAPIDSLLRAINQSLSTYIPQSYISGLNKMQQHDFQTNKDIHFNKNFHKAKEVYKVSEGMFDPTVMPLVNYYGFGYAKRDSQLIPTPKQIDSLKQLVGMNGFVLIDTYPDKNVFHKAKAEMQIDFSALAKGYAVDEISKYLSDKGCTQHLIDIGGDGLARGKNPEDQTWTIGINKPLENSPLHDFAMVIKLTDKAMATSGNYRNFYTVGEQKYVHTINPKTALTEKSNLLSVSVIADDCMTADAYATACMAMGLQRSIEMINLLDGIEACWIYDEKGEMKKAYSNQFSTYVQN